jgi:hypothetical protein
VTVDNRQPGAGLARQPDWRDPRRLAGLSLASVLGLGLLILIGSLADAVAFKTTLDILLRQAQILSWMMAVGATCLALVAAARLGVAIAVRRREDTRSASFTVAAAAITWLGLGLAMFITRDLDSGSTGPTFGTAAPQTSQHTTLIAIFFLAIYLASGTAMMIEAKGLYNPEAALGQRLGKHLDKQVTRTAKAEAIAVRAQEAVNLHDREMTREYIRYRAALTARQALAGEAASLARVRMAGQLKNPSMTAITETKPTLELPSADDEDGDELYTDPDKDNKSASP